MDYAWELEDAMSSHMSGWGVSKHIEMCLWALPLLCSVLWPGLVWSPLPSQLPVLLVPFCYVGLGGGMLIPGWKPPLPTKRPPPPPLLGP